MRNNPDNNETPRRFVIVESNIVFAEPNDIKAIGNWGFHNQLTLRRPIIIVSLEDIVERGEVDVHLDDVSKSVPSLNIIGEIEKDMLIRIFGYCCKYYESKEECIRES